MNGGQRSTSTSTGTNFNSYTFDFGLPNSRSSSSSQPLRGNPSPSPPSAAPIPTPSWSYQPGSRPAARPSWTHQPAAGPTANPSAGPTSMVGDIFGKNWSSSTTSNTSSIGIPQNNPNLFGDLFASALGSGSGRGSNVPLKSMGCTQKSSFSMNNLSDSLPEPTDSGLNFATFGQARGSTPNPMGSTGKPIRSATGSFGSAPQMGQKKAPFESLTGFGSNQKPAMKSTPAPPANSTKPDLFGSTNSTHFDAFPAPPKAQTFSSSNTTTTNKSSPMPNDDIGMFFTSKTTPTPQPPANEMNDWDIASDFAAADGGGTTTELEGLPPPPAGLTGAAAKSKGMDNYKQGQYADAIKWLSWAVVILEKHGDRDSIAEVLTSRASSYKEVGEYKKAIADCSKVLEQDKENVSVLTQRALLYESSEKYRLSAEDLRMVLKIDPGNRLARSTIHRVQKMAD